MNYFPTGCKSVRTGMVLYPPPGTVPGRQSGGKTIDPATESSEKLGRGSVRRQGPSCNGRKELWEEAEGQEATATHPLEEAPAGGPGGSCRGRTPRGRQQNLRPTREGRGDPERKACDSGALVLPLA